MAIERTIGQEDAVPTIAPHGGTLIDRMVHGKEADEMRQRAGTLPALRLSGRQLSDLELIANGAFSPLTGFMARADYERVVTEMALSDGLPWSIPVTLAVDSASAPPEGADVALYGPQGALCGTMRAQSVYGYDKRREARDVYRTEDEDHPGVAALYAQGDTLVGGPVVVLPIGESTGPYDLPPAETRRAFGAGLAHRRRLPDA